VSRVTVSVSVSVKLQGTQAESHRTARPAVLASLTCAISLAGAEGARFDARQAPQMKGPRHRRLPCLYDHLRQPAPACDTVRQGATVHLTDIFTDITTDRP